MGEAMRTIKGAAAAGYALELSTPPSEPSQPVLSGLREMRLYGQCIVDSTVLREGDRLYLYANLGARPLVAVLQLAEVDIPFIPAG